MHKEEADARPRYQYASRPGYRMHIVRSRLVREGAEEKDASHPERSGEKARAPRPVRAAKGAAQKPAPDLLLDEALRRAKAAQAAQEKEEAAARRAASAGEHILERRQAAESVEMENTQVLIERIKEDEREEAQEEKKALSPLRNFIEWVAVVVVAMICAVVLRTYIIDFNRVQGPSMEPTLYTGERVAVNKMAYWFGGARRGDVVVCRFPNSSDHYIKRVIGLGGERVQIVQGTVYINGVALEEPYVKLPDTLSMPETLVPEDSYLVMGDHRSQSMDSRASSVGPIAKSAVLGRAFAVVWPLNRLVWIPRVTYAAQPQAAGAHANAWL
nr:signal peptidase I [Maliibacterium massiliense]